MAIDYTTPVGRVRNLINDVYEGKEKRFDDARIAGFLAENEDNVYLAAADAQEATATNQVLLLLVVNQQKGELETDGAKVAKALQDSAKALRARGEKIVKAATTPPAKVHRSRIRRIQGVC